MSNVNYAPHTVESAPEGSKQILEMAQKKYGFVANLLGNMAEAPALLEAYVTISQIFDKAKLSETERQIILMTFNRLNGCTYCMAAHTTLSQMAKVPADVIEALRTNTPIADAKLEALRQFAIIIHETRGYPTDAEVETFIAAGYTKETVLEVILGASYKVMSNYTNHIVHTEVDPVFAKNAWTPDMAPDMAPAAE